MAWGVVSQAFGYPVIYFGCIICMTLATIAYLLVMKKKQGSNQAGQCCFLALHWKRERQMNRLYCGAARGSITPPDELIPNLRGLGDRIFGGVLDDLFVRVIAVGDGLNKVLIIAFDLDKAPYPRENFARIFERTGIPEENIFFFSTHTHTAPITGFRPEEPINNVLLKTPEVQAATAEYEKLLTETMLTTIDDAIRAMRPARMGSAYEKSYINVNRIQDYEYADESGELHVECRLGANFAVSVDRTLFVLKFEDLNGQPIAFFMNYPVHNCVMIGNNCCNGKVGIGGDIAGRVCRFVEEKYTSSLAIWSSGAAGDLNPLFMNEIFYPDPVTGRAVESRLEGGLIPALNMLAARHFADVLKTIRKITCTADSVSIAGMVDWSFSPGRNVVVHTDSTTEIVVGDGVDPYEIRLHLVRLGNVALYGFSGELFSSLGRRIREISPLANTIIINHDASMMARCNYIFDDEILARNIPVKLPGFRDSHILPGHVLESLEKHTLQIFQKLGTGE